MERSGCSSDTAICLFWKEKQANVKFAGRQLNRHASEVVDLQREGFER